MNRAAIRISVRLVIVLWFIHKSYAFDNYNLWTRRNEWGEHPMKTLMNCPCREN